MAGLLDGLAALGYDPSSIQGLQSLVGALGPSDEDKRAARQQAWLLAGLGMMGARKGYLPQDLSRSAQMGLLSYNQDLKDLAMQRQQAIGQAATLMPLLQKTQWQRALNEPDVPIAPPVEFNNAPYAGQGMGDRGLGSIAPTGTPTGLPQIPQQGSLRQRILSYGVSPEELLATNGDPAKVQALITEYRKPIMGQNKVPIVRTPNGFQSVLPAGMAENTGAIAGAETGAQEAAKAQFDLVDVPMGSGQTQKMTRADAIRLLGANEAQQFPGVSLPYRTNFSGTPEQVAKLQGAAAQDFARTGGMGGPGMTASPLAMRAAENAQDISKAAQMEVNKGAIGQIDKQYETVANSATTGIPLVHEARQLLDSGKIISGAGANFGLNVGRALSQIGFKEADDPVKNTQTFMAVQARQVLAIIKSLGSGSGISDADREYAAKIVGGDISVNEGALRRLLDISERAQRAAIDAHNTRVEKAATAFKNPDLADLYKVEAPAAYVVPSRQTRSPSELPQRVPSLKDIQDEILRRQGR